MAGKITIGVDVIGARIEGNRLQALLRCGGREGWSTLIEAGVPRADGTIIAHEALPGMLADLREIIEGGARPG